MREFLIFHYEDEPSKVDFPGLIEVALFQHPLVTESDINEIYFDDQSFEITFSMNNVYSKITYFIGLSPDDILLKTGRSERDVMLHIVDMSINGNINAGNDIVNNLMGNDVIADRIWFVTAYEAKAAHFEQFGIRVYPKPSPFSTVISEIISIIENSIFTIAADK